MNKIGITYAKNYGPYIIIHEIVELCDDRFVMKSGYTPEGDYIGNSREAYRLWKKFGIERFEKTDPKDCVCSIGYSPSRKKWYGWSHRAIFGFTIGSKIKKGDCIETDRRMRVGTIAKTMAQAKRMARLFAESVS